MKKFTLFIILFFAFVININAYTKEDIINLASSINVCSTETSTLVSGLKTTYTRMLNERDISSSNLDKIYNNISYVKNVLNEYSVCSKENLSSLPSNIKDNLYNLYKETNKLITSSPKYIDIKEDNNKEKSNDEVQVVIDSTSKAIKIYEGGTLINVVESKEKLNYVGLNQIVIVVIVFTSILLLLMIILKILKRKSIFITSSIFSLIIILVFTFTFRNQLSIILDTLYTMNVKINDNEKTVAVKDNKIISYPSYGSKYATIIINGNKEDIYFGDDSSILSKGIGHLTKTSLPGENYTTVLSGHNTGLFKELFNLNKNDKVIIETIYGRFIYELIGNKVVDDTDISAIDEDYSLILYTCYPNSNLYGNKRLIMYFNIVSSEWLGDESET